MSDWVFNGRCHVFGDDIPLDDGLIPFDLAIRRVFEPERLIPHLFETIRPGFADVAKRGDVVVAGRRFACGKAHVQGFIALRAMGIAVACESMPFNSFRGAVSSGLTFMINCEGIASQFRDGEAIEADFSTGSIKNSTTGVRLSYAPLDPMIREIIAGGGTRGYLTRWWSENGAQPRAKTS